MITDPDRFQQDKSPYERPNFPYRCGRLRLWGKPCGRGPSSDGSCGGVSECRPFFDNGRWECRRSARSGGPCEHGPRPDGQCSQQHPPCKPMPSLRRYRGRLTALAAALVVALIAAFAFYDDSASALSTINPGPLSGGHENFTQEQGCVACHKPHGEGKQGWLSAAWTPSALSQGCTDCHTFKGPANNAHNIVFKDRDTQPQAQCVACHTEHKGAKAKITTISDQQCSTCHKKKFTSFSKGHPDFSKDFPSRRRTAIAFNHVSHFDKYFQDKRFAAKAPKDGCVACHDTTKAARNVPVRPFEKTCAACHSKQITERDVVLFTLPEFEENPFDAAEVAAACVLPADQREEMEDVVAALNEKLDAVADSAPGSAAAVAELRKRIASLEARLGLGDGPAGDAEEEYESVSTETLSPLGTLLLGVEDGEDPGSYTEPVRDLIMAMISDGDGPLLERLSGRPDGSMLLGGLSPELARNVACAWASNREYEPPADAVAGGWFADALSLRYRPIRHRDPVALAWLNLAAAGGEGVDESVRETLFSRTEGVGACAKCHSVSDIQAKASAQAGTGESGGESGDESGDVTPLKVEWKFGAPSNQRFVKYSHRPHLNLLGPGQSCATCHKIDPKAEYDAAFKHTDPTDFASNFKSIDKQTCAACHAGGQFAPAIGVSGGNTGRVRQECSLCHQYHNKPGFRRRLTTTASRKSP